MEDEKAAEKDKSKRRSYDSRSDSEDSERRRDRKEKKRKRSHDSDESSTERRKRRKKKDKKEKKSSQESKSQSAESASEVVNPETIFQSNEGNTNPIPNTDQTTNNEPAEEEPLKWIPRKVLRKQYREELLRKREGLSESMESAEEGEEARVGPHAKVSIFQEKAKAEDPEHKKSEIERLAEEEKKLLETMTQDIPLIAVKERAKDIKYTEPMKTTWKPPRWMIEAGDARSNEIRQKWGIIVEGEDIPPPVTRFKDLKLPQPIMDWLNERNIKTPTAIQVQGLPVLLSGRDMIGVAFTGSGKTLVFTLPMIMFALEEEMKMPIRPGEGPIGLVLCPSRELATQTYQIIQSICDKLMESFKYPRLKPVLTIGGQSLREQEQRLREGCHMIVATPGRLLHFLNEKRITLQICKYLVMDEADRLIDLGFEEDIRNVLDHFKGQRQTVLFSATMPRTIQQFARSALVKPVEVNVGRAGAANLDVIQEVEYVAQEAKIVYLLECLQKTPPPVIIFCENKSDVDDIHEYLLLKGVEAVAIHGGKDQEERAYAVEQFKSGKKDVLIATDVASKGLDFPNIQHVINFDMPKSIEDYIHRIGRTGRGGSTGIATTFVNKSVETYLLLDLKALLIEAKQRIPPFLENLEVEGANPIAEHTGVVGCAYCGGLGHRISNCPKAEQVRLKQLSAVRSGGSSRDFRGGGGY